MTRSYRTWLMHISAGVAKRRQSAHRSSNSYHMRHDSFVWDMTQSYKTWLISFSYETWLVHMGNDACISLQESPRDIKVLYARNSYPMRHDSFVWDMTISYKTWLISHIPLSYETWLVHMGHDSCILIKRTPPPGGVSYLLCSIIKNQEEEDFPRRMCTKCFEWGPLPPGSWLGNIVNRKPPGGGDFFRSMSLEASARDMQELNTL